MDIGRLRKRWIAETGRGRLKNDPAKKRLQGRRKLKPNSVYTFT
jgi:hypothetical protein